MTEEAIGKAGIAVEAVRAGGLGSEILAQATVTAAPAGEAIVTARAGGAVTQVFKRLGDPVTAGETLAVVQSRDAAQIPAERTAAHAKAGLPPQKPAPAPPAHAPTESARPGYEQDPAKP